MPHQARRSYSVSNLTEPRLGMCTRIKASTRDFSSSLSASDVVTVAMISWSDVPLAESHTYSPPTRYSTI